MKREEHFLPALGDRKLTLLVGEAVKPRRMCVFLDAEFYLDRLGAVEAIESLAGLAEIQDTAFVFVPYVEAARRHTDFICNDAFAKLIAEDVFQWMQARYADLPEGGHAICGLSLSGLASAHIQLNYPARFSDALCQSGSFWWQDEWLTAQLSGRSVEGRFWISVGDKETDSGLTHQPSGMRQDVSQIDANKRFADALTATGADVHFRIFQGGHAIAPWKTELPDALRWLLNPTRPTACKTATQA